MPVCAITDVPKPLADAERRIARLRCAGAVQAARKLPVTGLLSTSPPGLGVAASASAVLIEERRLDRLADSWNEVQPTTVLRGTARHADSLS
jgi:hypothetical protein